MKDNFLVLLVLRVSFTLFNLQGTRSGLSTSSAIYFSTLFFACQVLFQKFFNFSPKHSHSSFVRPFEELVHFTTLFRACQELFSSFPASFQARNPVFRPLFHKSRPLRRTRSVYHAHARLSSTFFSSNPKVRPASARSLPTLCRFFRARLTGAQI